MHQRVSGHARFDAARLARADAHLREKYLDTGKLPHAQLLIAREGEIVHFSHQGPARADSPALVDETSLFRIASMTKPVTSVAFMMLVEEGRVALDTPLHHVLPEFADTGVYNSGGDDIPFFIRKPANPIRMVDLLRHTSGLTYGFQERTPVDAAYRAGDLDSVASWHGTRNSDEFIATLARLPLEFDPGTAWNYSVSTDVLGVVVERLSGMSLDRFFAERIFAPLGMHDTFFTVPADKTHRLTDCWVLHPDKGRVLWDRGEASQWARPPVFTSGGGGLVSSALDYHRFLQLLLNGGTLDGIRLLGRKTIELMTVNHLPGGGDLATLSNALFSETTYTGVGFGLGFAITGSIAGTQIPGTPGEYNWGGMFSTGFFVDPVERISMVFMTQFSPSTLYPIRRELKTLIYAALD